MKALVTIVLFVLSVAVGYLLYRQPPVIAYVDSAKMLNSYQAMIDGRKVYQAKFQGWQNNVDTLSAGVQQAIKEYERKAAGMSEQEKVLSRQLLASKQKQFVEYQRAIQQNAQREEAKSNEKILAAVNAFLTRYGKDHDYDLILLASQAGTIAYARPALDLTDEVVAELNKEYIQAKGK
ncbi:OmpH family outer membrane protein [Hymenobacter elongatus]|uniref:OmpH family outer membrane protein n=1 Tax=Hymenobacter elongatus TaxID=877208 RepID=A0A4Z0PM83_9BACT|nr:OmpH family outer membrane protein [Hymenobacter elongatus]TGE17543.1 OmpH family outer membrane protein [Hymenobacter elongatus]